MNLRLWAFTPNGHGPQSYFTMAYSEHAAIENITEFLRKNAPAGQMPFIDFEKIVQVGYQVESVGMLGVITHDNW